jgi:hypothetical protein
MAKKLSGGWRTLMAVLLQTVSTGAAIAIHAVGVPLIFTRIAIGYFRARGAGSCPDSDRLHGDRRRP